MKDLIAREPVFPSRKVDECVQVHLEDLFVGHKTVVQSHPVHEDQWLVRFHNRSFSIISRSDSKLAKYLTFLNGLREIPCSQAIGLRV